jgi:FkbH-like protein
MFESELNNATESIETLPAEVLLRFAEYRHSVSARSMLPWGEHCTECVWPVCYTTCALYERRSDGACRQFVGPAVRIDHKQGLSPYILKIRFKQWGKLWTVGALALKPLAEADRAEQIHIAIGALARILPLPEVVKSRVLGKVRYRRTVIAEQNPGGRETPDAFVLECFNPNALTLALTLIVRPRDRQQPRCYEERIQLPTGYTRARIAFKEFARAVDMKQPFEVEVIPNGCENRTLYFGLMDFIKERRQLVSQSGHLEGIHKFKCIVWDLDNTLWDGVLVEDGPRGIRIREEAVEVIKETDRRGILHSIASKNNREDALDVLREHGLEDYFLYPQIDWTLKSQSIARIANLMNIGIDAIAFVDDQTFEREEVRSALAGICVIDAAECNEIPARPECQVTVTAESKNRRMLYRKQEERAAQLENYKGDYFGFLRTCEMEVTFRPLAEDNLQRIYELAQRTNQMNFSGSRYEESELREIICSLQLKSYVIQCRDRYGDYGIVGFAVVDTVQPCLLELMFSCRVQAKRVEHAVLSFLIKQYAGDRERDFYARYRKTAKNAPSGRVFAEIGFEVLEEADGMSLLTFRRNREIPDDGIVRVEFQSEEGANVRRKCVDRD